MAVETFAVATPAAQVGWCQSQASSLGLPVGTEATATFSLYWPLLSLHRSNGHGQLLSRHPTAWPERPA